MYPAAAGFDRATAAAELHRIAAWWIGNTRDTVRGGFVGRVEHDGRRVEDANRGVILYSRILWFFSEIARFDDRPGYREAAGQAFAWLLDRFDDPRHGGPVWELAADGTVVNGKKQVYALAFCILALAAYYRLTGEPAALARAMEYFELIEARARDPEAGGYLEAFTREWQPLDDVRLGATDLNAPRTMNTHLHVLEAYTALHRAAPGERTREALANVTEVMCGRIFDPERGCLSPYFDARWQRLSPLVSFGHDIEASWLLWEAAVALREPSWRQRSRAVSLRLAENCLRAGFGAAGQLCESLDSPRNARSETGIWWVQAEALVGFLNAFQLTGEAAYRAAADRVWRFIADHLLDAAAGEWHWQFPAAPEPHYKAGFWKGPYHNGRAMLEACRRFDSLGES